MWFLQKCSCSACPYSLGDESSHADRYLERAWREGRVEGRNEAVRKGGMEEGGGERGGGEGREGGGGSTYTCMYIRVYVHVPR